MTKEQAKDKIVLLYELVSEDMKQAIDVLVDDPRSEFEQMGEIGTLLAEATKDCISRKVVEKITWEEPAYSDKYNVLTEVRDKVRALPPTTPDLSEYSDKLYKLAYERGKAEGLNIPEGATNGDVMEQLFDIPFDWIKYCDEYYASDVLAWWNAPYKQEKNE